MYLKFKFNPTFCCFAVPALATLSGETCGCKSFSLSRWKRPAGHLWSCSTPQGPWLPEPRVWGPVLRRAGVSFCKWGRCAGEEQVPAQSPRALGLPHFLLSGACAVAPHRGFKPSSLLSQEAVHPFTCQPTPRDPLWSACSGLSPIFVGLTLLTDWQEFSM